MKKHLVQMGMALFMAAALTGCQSSGGAQTTAGDTKQAQATAQSDWPSKTLQLICPFAAGGDSDVNARWIAEYLTKEMGIDVVVVNVDGNGGAVGARQAKGSPTDGSTALVSSTAFLTNELSGAIDFGLDAFEMSCIFAEGPGNIICVNKDLGVNTFQELIDYSKANPGKLKMAYNTGATTHAIALQILDAGVDAKLVDAGDSSSRIASLLGGHVDVIINAYGSVKDYLESGDFVGLGLTGDRAAEYIPDYPCLKDEGYNVSFPTYYFLAFPKGTDPELAKKLSESVKNIVENNEDYAKAIKDGYFQTPVYYDSEEAVQKMEAAKEEIVKYTSQFQQK